jgi:Helix-turn-helix domain
MSIRLMAAVWQNGPRDRSQLLLMLALADCANDQGVCWPGTATLADKTRMDVRTVLRGLKALEQAQWLKIVRRSHERRGNTYELNLGRFNDATSCDMVSHDNLSHDKTTPSHVTKRAMSHDISCNPPHPPIGRTVKNHQEPSDDHVVDCSPEMVAQAVKEELGLGGRQVAMCLVDICKAKLNAGADPTKLRNDLINAWTAYKAASENLEWAYGSPEKFYASDRWHSSKLWPWKSGHPRRRLQAVGE